MWLTCFKLLGLSLGALLCFCWCFVRDVTGTSIKRKQFYGDKADSLKRVWLNVRITAEAPQFTDVSNRHVNKDFYSIQELCRNICTLL